MQSVIFRDRIDAADRLVEKLLHFLQEKDQTSSTSVTVLAIPRGGVVIGDIVATKLDAKLDIIVSRKIGAPSNEEFAIGAVMPDGTYLLDNEAVRPLNVPHSYIENQVNLKVKEIEYRLMRYRGSKQYETQLKGKRILLVDDGIATGATILSAAQWLKTKQNCQELIIAVPVGPQDTVTKIERLLVQNDVIVLHCPEPFIAVGRFYENFDQVSDEKVVEIMKRHGYKI
ncbi:phosphoribosyltransferase [Nitrososphaera sp. AFS]|uniref:phosphoribosyltransferase n=1 Tax=Nitrososphaera sp. AFS TaxID=2301191 RepID=UPI0013922EED|nr:phosphoribosyltransferase family protein [Nitrososphaera sp. AFS]NAL77596.1 phosphoribosyltransferase [Nitrososphaera sp. AFS]